MFNLWWFLVHFNLLALRTSIAGCAFLLAACRWNRALNTTRRNFVASPIENQSTIKNWFAAAIAHLFLQFGCHIEGASPNLHFGQFPLEAGF